MDKVEISSAPVTYRNQNHDICIITRIAIEQAPFKLFAREFRNDTADSLVRSSRSNIVGWGLAGA
jgi:hypothetical protein